MRFEPYPTRSGFVSLAVLLTAVLAAIYLLGRLFEQSNPPQIFQLFVGALLILVSAGLAATWTLIAFKLDYHLNRNGLTIQWGLSQQVIPINKIGRIVPGSTLSGDIPFRGINIAGLRFGQGQTEAYGLLKFRSTAPLADSLLIVTPNWSYVISPRQADRFLQAWQQRQSLGPTQQWQEGARRSGLLGIPLFTDPVTWWLLSLAAFFLISLFGFISLAYPEIPQTLPIHFDSLGRADRIAPKMALFTLPAAGGLVWLANAILGGLVYRREPLGAYLLWGSSIVMQLGLWIALLTITGA